MIAVPFLEAIQALKIPLFHSFIPAGFPSPAEDYIDQKLSLDEHLIKHPAATYFARAQGDSMKDAGILDGALLVVDRSVEATHGRIIVASLNGEFTCKYLDKYNRQLVAANSAYKPIRIEEGMDFDVEGVVIHWINSSP